MPTTAHRLVSPIPMQAPKRRKLVEQPCIVVLFLLGLPTISLGQILLGLSLFLLSLNLFLLGLAVSPRSDSVSSKFDSPL